MKLYTITITETEDEGAEIRTLNTYRRSVADTETWVLAMKLKDSASELIFDIVAPRYVREAKGND